VSEPRRATVWWKDAHHGGEQYQTLADARKDHRPFLRADTGWIMHEDDVGVSLALSWLPLETSPEYLQRPGGAPEFHCVSFLPRCMIERVEYLVLP